MASPAPPEASTASSGPPPTPPPSTRGRGRAAVGKKRRLLAAENNPAFAGYSAEEEQFYATLGDEERHSIVRAERTVHELNGGATPLRFKILASALEDEVKAIAIKKLDYLSDLEPNSGEYFKTASWIDAVCRLPLGRVRPPPPLASSGASDDTDGSDATDATEALDASERRRRRIGAFLASARADMDRAAFGHADAKDQIVRMLAQWAVNPRSKGLVLGIQGPMGCGKTTLIKDGICRALGLPFALIPLGGASDSSYLEGHSYTYEGATWGKVVDVLMRCGCMNPVLYFDELDKVSDSPRGEEIVNILMHLTDASQNDRFHDRYFTDLEFDVSHSLIIFSFNHEDRINPILRDRMVRIRTSGYSEADKVRIAQQHLLPDVSAEYAFCAGDVVFPDAVLRRLVAAVEPEEGVRNLRRALHSVLSHLNLRRLTQPLQGGGGGIGCGSGCGSGALRLPHTVSDADVDRFLGAGDRRGGAADARSATAHMYL